MMLCKAYNLVNTKGINPWMAYAILKLNDGYCIFPTQQIKRFPYLDYVYIRKGNCFPRKPTSLRPREMDGGRRNELVF